MEKPASKANWSVKMACQVTQDVAAQLAQLRKEDYGPLYVKHAVKSFFQLFSIIRDPNEMFLER